MWFVLFYTDAKIVKTRQILRYLIRVPISSRSCDTFITFKSVRAQKIER